MIYLDCAATSLQKPETVAFAVSDAVRHLASPGRGGYPEAMRAADVLLDCREALAELFQVADPARVSFTSSATHGLNIAIKSLIRPGDRVVISGYEHNAVTRPLRALGAQVCVASSPLFDREAAVRAFRRLLPGARAAVCCHVSNVYGYLLPLEQIAAECAAAGVPLVVDASQSAGSVPLPFDALGCAFAAMPGHKGLLGPQGTGVLLTARDQTVGTLLEGGTGSDSANSFMPAYLPDRLEAGTHNMPGIAGLLAGVRYVLSEGAVRIGRRERALARRFIELAPERVIATAEDAAQAGVVSCVFDGVDCEEAAAALAAHGVAVRAGLHCAPLAHRTGGTLQTGTVRFSFSPFLTEEEVVRAADTVRRVLVRG